MVGGVPETSMVSVVAPGDSVKLRVPVMFNCTSTCSLMVLNPVILAEIL